MKQPQSHLSETAVTNLRQPFLFSFIDQNSLVQEFSRIFKAIRSGPIRLLKMPRLLSWYSNARCTKVRITGGVHVSSSRLSFWPASLSSSSLSFREQGWCSVGEQGWCSGESARLPPMWPGFDSRPRRHMWDEFVGSLLWSERFFSGYSGFSLSTKTNTWFDLISFNLMT